MPILTSALLYFLHTADLPACDSHLSTCKCVHIEYHRLWLLSTPHCYHTISTKHIPFCDTVCTIRRMDFVGIYILISTAGAKQFWFPWQQWTSHVVTTLELLLHFLLLAPLVASSDCNLNRKRHGEPNNVRLLSAVTVRQKVIYKTNSDWPACVALDVDSYFLVSLNLAHSYITINVSTQKSLFKQNVQLCTNPSYK